MNRFTQASIAVLLLASTHIATAASITIDPNNFPIGTDISNATPGITFSYVQLNTGGATPDVTNTFLSQAPAVVGNIQFGAVVDHFASNTIGAFTGGDSDAQELRAIFTNPVSVFQFQGVSDSGDPFMESFFDTHGNFLGSTIVDGVGVDRTDLPTEAYYTAYSSTFNSSVPIGSVTFGSTSAAGFITGVEVQPVPLPGTLPLLLSGIVAAVAIGRFSRVTRFAPPRSAS